MTKKQDDLTREQLLDLLNQKENEIETLKTGQGETMPSKVMALIESGYRTIDELATELGTNNRNISSNLTYIRRDLKPQGKWLVSSKIDGKTYLKVIDLAEFGWI